MIPQTLKANLLRLLAGGVSALAIAGALRSHYEGDLRTPYQDVNGVWTVCEGHTGPDVLPGKTYTDGECATLADRDSAKADAAVTRLVKVSLSTAERAALIDFVFNVGEGNFARSTMLRKINAGDRVGACNEYKRWVYAGGRRYQGLANRREAEEWLCSMR